MPIRTEEEYRAAHARLDEQTVIMRSRSFTDDEQHDFDALTRDLAAYQGARPAAAGATAVIAAPSPSPSSPAASPPCGAQRRDAGAPVQAGRVNLLGAAPSGAPAPAPVDLVADMKRRHGIAA